MTSGQATRSGRGRGALVLVLAVAYAIGFLAFVESLPRALPKNPHADGIVALTGGNDRLDAATALFEKGIGKRLLITGVHPTTTKDALKKLVHGGSRFDCCADLGFQATNTRGNAAETAQWVREHNYRSLVVVTATYHMPRSLSEFAARMPKVKLIAYPVASESFDIDRWWNSPVVFSVLQWEYVKYIGSITLNTLFPPLGYAWQRHEVQSNPA